MNRASRHWVRIALLTAVAAFGAAGRPGIADPVPAGDAALFARLDVNGDGRISPEEVSPEAKRLFNRLIRRADRNRDSALSREEFLTGLVPSRPEKPIEEKQPATFPQADAVRWLLLSLDTNGDRQIEATEVPESLRSVFESLLEPIDRNGNGRLDTAELNRGGARLASIAGRYVSRERIDVAAELKRMERSQGDAVYRFDDQPTPMEMLSDPNKARSFFAQLDDNGDGRLESSEVPEPFRPQFERFMRLGDRDRDGQLSEREFLNAAEQLSNWMRRASMERPRPDDKSDRDGKSAR